jgi:sec-independent protein translocase protein TatB
MFDLDAGKLIVIGIVALIVIPSKDLPRVLRQLGQAVGRIQRLAAEFRGQFMEAIREAELHELKQEVDKVKESVKLDSSFDPLAEARKQIVQATEGPVSSASETPAETNAHQEPAHQVAHAPAEGKPPAEEAGA